MAYVSWAVVFGEQPSAAKWNILGANDASFNDGTGIADGAIKPEHLLNGSSALNTWAWDTWTPTLSGLFTDADWTKTGSKYIQIGKTVIATLKLISADATPMGGAGEATFTLPVTSAALVGTANIPLLGWVNIFDTGGSVYPAHVGHASTTTAIIRAQNAASTYLVQATLTNAVPFTWASGDEIMGTFVYEAA